MTREIKDFFKFGSKFVSSTIQVEALSLRPLNPNEELDQDRLGCGDYAGISFPVVFRHEIGRKWQDMLDTGTVSLRLISDHMKKILVEHRLTGWGTFPIVIQDKKGNQVPGYHGFSTLGRCGPVIDGKGERFKKQLVPHGSIEWYYRGLYVGLDEWDGTDFFLPRGYRGTIVTKRAAEVLKQAKLTNVALKNLQDIETSESMLIRMKWLPPREPDPDGERA